MLTQSDAEKVREALTKAVHLRLCLESVDSTVPVIVKAKETIKSMVDDLAILNGLNERQGSAYGNRNIVGGKT